MIQAKWKGLYLITTLVYLKTQPISSTKINWVMLFKQIVTVYTENHTEQINTLCGQNAVIDY
jgi:hypothetical protein